MDDEATKYRALQRRLNLLEDQVRSNEHIWSGFNTIERQMLEVRSLGRLIDVVVDGFINRFGTVDYVTVACLDPEYELSRMLEKEPDVQWNGSFIALPAGALDAVFPPPFRPWLGQFDPVRHQSLFPSPKGVIGSVAVVPLIAQGEVIGSLNQCSPRGGHFEPGAATDLLEHLAAITALCIDNVVSHERLKLDGLTDALTGISNRRFFERRVVEEADRWRRTRLSLSCLVVDIDHFKKINDGYGHQAGDRVLQRVARELEFVLRSSDVLARYGGEEFVLLLPDTDLPEAAEIANRIRGNIAAVEFETAELKDVAVTASVGVACLGPDHPDESDPGEILFRYADNALYSAKHNGRNRVVVAQPRT
ncbi:MAG: sensor domain-containing diguanylate cyclase [Acidiferrobacteraceae bacterium]|jgi:two-component system cell cycle response regulator